MTGRAAMVRSALVLAIGASLVGCAVMRIDVDVYKGPLANHEDVQAEQMAAMAVGARPLLTRIKCDLLKRASEQGVKLALVRLKESGICEFDQRIIGAGLVRPLNPVRGSLPAMVREGRNLTQLKQVLDHYSDQIELIRLVDAVESLYLDLDEIHPEVKILKLVEKAQEETTRAESALQILVNTNVTAGQIELKEKLGNVNEPQSLKPLAAAYANFLVVKKDKLDRIERPDCEFLKGKKRYASRRYWESVRETYRSWCGIFAALFELKNTKLKKDLLAGYNEEKLPDRQSVALSSSNEGFRVLTEERLLRAHAEQFFPRKNDLQQKFVAEVRRVAKSFGDVRQATYDLLGSYLQILPALKAAELGPAKPVLVEKMAKRTVALISTRHFDLAAQSMRLRAVQDLKRRYDNLKNGREALARLLTIDTAEVSAALLEAHVFFATAETLDPSVFEKPRNKKFRQFARRRYGLVSGPGILESQSKGISQFLLGLRNSLHDLRSAVIADFALDRGRLRQGLYRLIEDYLKAKDDNDKKAKRQRLFKALVRFAEKLLFIANHEAIFTPGGGQNDEDRSLVRRYVQVLQAIGNSILIQADELRSREAHETNLKDKDRTRAELQALKKKFPKLGAVQLGNNENARDVLDRLIAALRYEHIKALKNPVQGAGSAKDIAAALKVAYEQRAGMAYIRPSASYLRSSFPATSLQDDPRLAWENMLTGHARRSFSPFGAWLGTEEKLRQTINAEIDKQFWQNINSVRVSGAGATNYVIVKDDIGNWYVKSFSADPESIIKSAQQLAMFNLGGQMGTNLIRQRDLQRKVDSEKATEEDKAELKKLREQGRRGGNGTLDRHFVIRQREYESRTQQDFDNLKAGLEANQIKERIKTAWSANPDTKEFATKLAPRLEFAAGADGPLARALAEMKKSSGNAKADKAAQGVNIVTALQAFGSFHSLLVQQVRAARLSERPAEELKSWEKKKKERDDELAETTKKLRDAEAKRDLAQANLNTEEAKKTEEKPNKPAIDKAKTKLATEKTNVGVAIGNADKAELAAMAARDAVDAARQALKKAKRGEEAAISEVTRIVRDELIKIAARRQDTVKTFETSVTFIGGAASPAPQP